MPDNEKLLAELRQQLQDTKSSRAACKGDPEMLRELDDDVRRLQAEIRRLGS